MKKVCIVGASGKLGQHMVRHALERGYEVVGVCRARSVGKLDAFKGHITVIPGATNDREIIKTATAGCDGVLTVLVPWGVDQHASGTAQAVLDLARPGARLIFSCCWHITRDGQDVYSPLFKAAVKIFGWLARLIRVAELDDQVQACRRPDPEKQSHAPCRLCAVHGGGPGGRQTGPRGPVDCRPPRSAMTRTAASASFARHIPGSSCLPRTTRAQQRRSPMPRQPDHMPNNIGALVALEKTND